MNEDKLGALELCSALNGEDAELAIQCLKQFIKTVREERHLSLVEQKSSSSLVVNNKEDNNESMVGDDDEDDDTTLPKSKKQKQDNTKNWKEDSKGYNVPFVGTSSNFTKGDVGTVVPNTWPTGLLSAYINSSPNAVEFVGSSNSLLPPNGYFHKELLQQQNKKGSVMLHVLYLEALIELLSIDIPLSLLRDDLVCYEGSLFDIISMNLTPATNNNRSGSTVAAEHTNNILSSIVKLRLSYVFNLMTELSSSSNDNRNKAYYSKEDTDLLYSTCLNFLSNVASTSSGAALEVARGLDILPHTTVNLAFRGISRQTDYNNAHGKQQQKKNVIHQLAIESACLRLATTLLQSQDGNVLSLITSRHNKEKKAGFVTRCFIDGIVDLGTNPMIQWDTLEPYFRSVAIFLKAIRHCFFGFSKKYISNRIKVDFLTSDGILEKLNHMTSHCNSAFPLRTSQSHEQIIEANDNHYSTNKDNNMTTFLQYSIIEARRVLFILLANELHSPILIHLKQHRLKLRNSSTQSINHLYYSLSQSLEFIVASNNSKNAFSMRFFLLHCLKTTPPIAPILFQILSIPELAPENNKLTLQSLSTLETLGFLIKKGPSLGCFTTQEKATDVLACVIPSSLTKMFKTSLKVCASPLLILQLLKLLNVILHRVHQLLIDLSTDNTTSLSATAKDTQEKRHQPQVLSVSSLMDALEQQIPNFQALIQLRNHFDPFKKTTASTNTTQKFHFILTFHIYEALSLFKKCLPNVVESSKFDWTTKLFPLQNSDDNVTSFLQSCPSLQYRIIKTLWNFANPVCYKKEIWEFQGKYNRPYFHFLIQLALRSTTQIQIRKQVKRLLMLSIQQNIILNRSTEDTKFSEEQDYEIYLWVTYLLKQPKIAADFEKMLDLSYKKYSLEHTVVVLSAWKQLFPNTTAMPAISFTPLLTNALLHVTATNNTSICPELIVIVSRILLKTLVYAVDVLPLVSLILHCTQHLQHTTLDKASSQDAATPNPLQYVRQYATEVLKSYSLGNGQSTTSTQEKNQQLTHNSASSVTYQSTHDFYDLWTKNLQNRRSLTIQKKKRKSNNNQYLNAATEKSKDKSDHSFDVTSHYSTFTQVLEDEDVTTVLISFIFLDNNEVSDNNNIQKLQNLILLSTDDDVNDDDVEQVVSIADVVVRQCLNFINFHKSQDNNATSCRITISKLYWVIHFALASAHFKSNRSKKDLYMIQAVLEHILPAVVPITNDNSITENITFAKSTLFMTLSLYNSYMKNNNLEEGLSTSVVKSLNEYLLPLKKHIKSVFSGGENNRELISPSTTSNILTEKYTSTHINSYWFLLSTFPSQINEHVVFYVLQSFAENRKNSDDTFFQPANLSFLLSYVNQLLPSTIRNAEYSSKELHFIFNDIGYNSNNDVGRVSTVTSLIEVWTMLLSTSSQYLTSKTNNAHSNDVTLLWLVRCVEKIENLMTYILLSEEDGVGAWMIFSKTVIYSPWKITKLCLLSKFLRLKQEQNSKEKVLDNKHSCFLSGLLFFDCYTYAPPVLKCLSDMSIQESQDNLDIGIDVDVSVLWNSGVLDKTVVTTMREMMQLQETSIDSKSLLEITEPFDSVVEQLIERVCDMFASNDTFVEDISSNCILDVVHTCCILVRRGYVSDDACEKLLTRMLSIIEEDPTWNLSATSSKKSLHNVVYDRNFISLATYLIVHYSSSTTDVMDDNDSLKDNKVRDLSSRLLVKLASALPNALKATKNTTRVHGKNTKITPHHDAMEIMHWIFVLLSKNQLSFNENIITKSSKYFLGVVLSCLKYGISDKDNKTSTACLCLIQKFIIHSYTSLTTTEDTPPRLICLSSIINVANIHAMIVSHSKFATALSGTSEENKENNDDAYINDNTLDGTTLALDLLSMEEKKIKCVNTKTQLLSILIHCVSFQNSVDVESSTWNVLFTCYSASMSHFDVKINHLMRLYRQKCVSKQTIPYADELQWGTSLGNLTSVTSTGNSNDWEWLIPKLDIRRILCTLRHFPAGEVEDENNIAFMEENNEIHIQNEHPELQQFGVDDDNSSSDIRYSISFILPMILAAFESYFPDEKAADNKNQQAKIIFAEKAFRLIEHGALALSLAALSCKTDSLRQISISILYLFIKSCSSKEAEQISAWKSLPQILMILRSVQKGLVLNSVDNTEYGVAPIFPVVSAIFLARSSLIVTKPRDAMYSHINRFFLAIDDNHGAFTNFPPFISFYFNSTTECQKQATNQRLWSLQLLRDGAIDDESFNILVYQHNIPALLLTSFDGVSSWNNYSKNTKFPLFHPEKVCLLEVIHSLIDKGGTLAATHFVEKCGLLSWIKGALESRNFSYSFPTLEIRCVLMNILLSVIRHQIGICKSNEDNSDKDTKTKHPHILSSSLDILILAKSILKVFFHTWINPDLVVGNDKKSHQFKMSVLNAFLSVKSYHLQIERNSLENEYGCFFANPFNAIQMSTALLFLKEVIIMDDSIATLKVIAFIFFLPFDLMKTEENYCKEDIFVEMCICSLKAVLSTKKHNEESNLVVRNVLRKISALSTNYVKKLEHQRVLVQLVSLCWIYSHCTYYDREIWKKCTSVLSFQEADAMQISDC